MRGHFFGCALALIALVSCNSIPSGSPHQEGLINEFLDGSFLRQELTQLSAQTAQASNTKVAKAGSEAEAKGLAFNREIEEALRPETTVPLTQAYLRSQHTETLEAILQWLRTPLAERMLVLSAQPFDYNGFNTYQVEKTGLRLDLIPRLDKATHTSEWQIEDTAQRAKVFQSLLEEKGKAAQSDGKLDPMIEHFVRTQSLRKLAFVYRTASDLDLQQYIDFLESTVGQSYIMIRRNALAAGHSKAQTVLAKLPTLVQSVK